MEWLLRHSRAPECCCCTAAPSSLRQLAVMRASVWSCCHLQGLTCRWPSTHYRRRKAEGRSVSVDMMWHLAACI